MTRPAASIFFLATLLMAAAELRLGERRPWPGAEAGRPALIFAGEPAWPAGVGPRLEAVGAMVVISAEVPAGKALLIDGRGILRRKGPAPESAEEAVAFVKEWELGRASFLNRCARCHGEDGADTGSPYIRALTGIGNRMNAMPIRAKLFPTVVQPDYITARGEPFTAQELDALIVFVAGL